MRRKPFPIVAVTDEEPDDQLLLKSAFEKCRPDLDMRFFGSGEELLAFLHEGNKYEKEASKPDLIIIALHLPETMVFELIKEVKAEPDLRRIPIIVLTDSSSDMEIKHCYDLGANTVITRPSLFDDLVQALNTICGYWFGPIRM